MNIIPDCNHQLYAELRNLSMKLAKMWEFNMFNGIFITKSIDAAKTYFYDFGTNHISLLPITIEEYDSIMDTLVNKSMPSNLGIAKEDLRNNELVASKIYSNISNVIIHTMRIAAYRNQGSALDPLCD